MRFSRKSWNRGDEIAGVSIFNPPLPPRIAFNPVCSRMWRCVEARNTRIEWQPRAVAKETRERERGGIFTQRAFMTVKLSTGGYTRGNREFRGYTRESAIITSSILSLLGTGL